MNRYQKVITCIIQLISVAILFYSMSVTLVAMMMSAQLWKLSFMATGPTVVVGLLLFVMAIPISKLITLGIRDD